MSKEIAQTVGGKKVAWLIAIVAAMAVLATLGTQWRGASAVNEADVNIVVSSAPAAGDYIAPEVITYTIAVNPVTNPLLDGVVEADIDNDFSPVTASYATTTGATGACTVNAGAGNKIVCPVGPLNLGATATVTILATAPGTDSIAVLINGNGNGIVEPGEVLVRSGVADQTPADDIDTNNSLAYNIVSLETAFVKSGPTNITSAAQTVNYTLTYTNPSGVDVAAGGLTIVDAVNPGTGATSVGALTGVAGLTCTVLPAPPAAPLVNVSCTNTAARPVAKS